MKMGFLCSSGGSTPLVVSRLLIDAGLMDRDSFVLLTDRECGALEAFTREGMKTERIDYTDKVSFSRVAADFFIREGVGIVFLFYSRLVTEELFSRIPVINCHPSLLPAFSGFKALKRTVESGARFIGATSHVVNANPDAGQILVQTVHPIPANCEVLDEISFVQRILVTLVCADHLLSGNCRIDPMKQSGYWVSLPQSSLSVNPTFFNKELAEKFLKFQKYFKNVTMQITPMCAEVAGDLKRNEGNIIMEDILQGGNIY